MIIFFFLKKITVGSVAHLASILVDTEGYPYGG